MTSIQFMDEQGGLTYVRNKLLADYDWYLLNEEKELREYIDLLLWFQNDFNDPIDPDGKKKASSLSMLSSVFKGVKISV